MGRGRTNRRELIGWSAALALTAVWKDRAGARAHALGWRDPSQSRADQVENIVRWILTTPRDPALRRAARELHAGLDPAQLLGAILVASARDIRTDRAAFNHSALSVSSIDQLTGSATPEVRQRDVLWCLDHFKEAQETEARSEDWRMAPIEAARVKDGARARAALVDALESWDRDAADVAVAGWVRSAPLDEVYALIWEYGLRCVSNIGHKGIYAALSRRALPLAGDRFAEDVLRSVVSSFFLNGRTLKSAAFERSRELVERGIVARTARPVSDVGPARELLSAIRQSTSTDAPSVVAKLLEDGAARSTLWDAVVIAACEVSVAVPSVASLHAVTSTNSLHYIARHAPSERVAQLALSQSAAWVAEFRTGLKGEETAFRIDGVEAAPSTMDAILAEDVRGMPAVRGALWLGVNEPDSFLERAHALARTKSDDVHEFKLAAAGLEEARVVGAWARPFVCAALAVHLPAPTRSDGTRPQRIRDSMEVASTR
jgi:hypothetical protein